ncbi:Uncharacterised protein [Nocardia africana]|uniref:Uncharacterized protein n=1 Tax=Nocardia africana TaxID=134964 RepID=A0A378WM69_9NOCA|nr:Uncharacterised protein [Nocardia africana]
MTATAIDHRRCDGPHAVDEPPDVHIDRGVSHRIRLAQERARGHHTGIIHQDVDPPKIGDNLVPPRPVAHIQFDRAGAEIGRRGGGGRGVHIGDDHLGSLVREQLRGGPADTATGAGDENAGRGQVDRRITVTEQVHANSLRSIARRVLRRLCSKVSPRRRPSMKFGP